MFIFCVWFPSMCLIFLPSPLIRPFLPSFSPLWSPSCLPPVSTSTSPVSQCLALLLCSFSDYFKALVLQLSSSLLCLECYQVLGRCLSKDCKSELNPSAWEQRSSRLSFWAQVCLLFTDIPKSSFGCSLITGSINPDHILVCGMF